MMPYERTGLYGFIFGIPVGLIIMFGFHIHRGEPLINQIVSGLALAGIIGFIVLGFAMAHDLLSDD